MTPQGLVINGRDAGASYQDSWRKMVCCNSHLASHWQQCSFISLPSLTGRGYLQLAILRLAAPRVKVRGARRPQSASPSNCELKIPVVTEFPQLVCLDKLRRFTTPEMVNLFQLVRGTVSVHQMHGFIKCTPNTITA